MSTCVCSVLCRVSDVEAQRVFELSCRPEPRCSARRDAKQYSPAEADTVGVVLAWYQSVEERKGCQSQSGPREGEECARICIHYQQDV